MRGTRAAAKIVTNDQQAAFDKKGLPSSLQLHVLRHNRKHSHSSSLDLGVGRYQHAVFAQRVVRNEVTFSDWKSTWKSPLPTADVWESPKKAVAQKYPGELRELRTMTSPPTMKHDYLEPLEPQNHHEYDTTKRPMSVVTQTGVKRVEAVAMTWTKQSLYVAYAGFAINLCFLAAIYYDIHSRLTKKPVDYFLWRFAHHSIFRLLAYLRTTQLQPFRRIHYLLPWGSLAVSSMV